MKPRSLFSLSLVGAALFLALSAAGLRAEETTQVVKFSDPTKPGKIKVMVARGDLRIHAADTNEVTVVSNAKAENKAQRKDGLRVLSAASSFSLTEQDNVITLDGLSESWAGAGADFRLTVPRNTSIVVQSSWGGDIQCAGITGDIEINCLNGGVKLEDVGGGVVVSTMNGEITASIRELRENKPLSFTSMNGEVVLRVPGDAKANVRLRTQNGSVLTDFDETALVTKTEAAPQTARRTRSFQGLPPEARAAIHEATRVAVQVGREAAAAVRDGFEAAQESIERERPERAERAERRGGTTSVPPAPPVPAIPPVPPVPAVPTISGGKLVTGTLNGGGPEISVATMNGDVTLRQLKK